MQYVSGFLHLFCTTICLSTISNESLPVDPFLLDINMLKTLWIILALMMFTGTNIVHAQELEQVSFQTDDGLKIAASALIANPKTDARSPAIVFIHQGGSKRSEWTTSSLWKKLAADGYTLLAYDVRMHGDSGKDDGSMVDLFNNPKRSPNDLKAAIQFLKSKPTVNPDRIAVIGASIGGNLACVASADNSFGIKSAVAMSSKTAAAQNLSGRDELIKPKNVFHVASEDEQGGMRKKWAEELFERTTGERKVVIAKGKQHGSFILPGNPDLEDAIVAWIKKTL